MADAGFVTRGILKAMAATAVKAGTPAFITAYKPINGPNWFGVALEPTEDQIAAAISVLAETAKGIKRIDVHNPGEISKLNKKYEAFHLTVCYAIDEKDQAAAMAEFNDAKLTTADIRITDRVLVFDNRSTPSKTAFAVLYVEVSDRFRAVQDHIVKKYAGLLKDGTKWAPREPHCTVGYAA